MIDGAQDENAGGKADFAGLGSTLEGSEVQVFLCRGAQGARGGKPPRFDGSDDFGAVWIGLWVGSPAEVDEAHQLALANGIRVIFPPVDEPWGVREFRIYHPDGHVIRVGAGIEDCPPEAEGRPLTAG